MIFIVEGERLGFASVAHHRHYSGDGQTYIGELAVSEAAEGRGAGRALIAACEQWAREQGYSYLALATGAANGRARGFYSHRGFLEEDVTLVKRLEVS